MTLLLLYFVLYLIAFLAFIGAAFSLRRPDRPYARTLVALGLAAWVLTSVIASARALGN